LSLDTILFAGCLVHEPLTGVPEVRQRISLSKYPGVSQVHNFAEMFQIIDVLRGEKDVPPHYRKFLTRMTPQLAPVPNARDFCDIDVALLEPASPVEVNFRGYVLSRNCIYQHIVKPLHSVSKEAMQCANSWFRVGLMDLNESVRADTAERMLGYIPTDIAIGTELARAVVTEARPQRSDIERGFRRMQALLGRPIGVVTYTFRYMEDGRAISWPAGFKEEVVSVAESLGLPIFDPSPLVHEFGVSRALLADQGHYSEAFLPTIADALATFAESVVRSA